MKIGILTYVHAINYGAFLQAYALCARLNQEADFEAEIIDYRMEKEKNYYDRTLKFNKNLFSWKFNVEKYNAFENAQKKLPLSSDRLVTDDEQKFLDFVKDKYDVIIMGSDEIWKVDNFRGFPNPYFLSDEVKAKKISYAASGRTDLALLSDQDRQILKKRMSGFSYIGVRDKKTQYELERLLGKDTDVSLNYDPSFVYDFCPNSNNGKKILEKSFHINPKKRTIAVMYNEKSSDSPNLTRFISRHYKEQFNLISLYTWNPNLKMYPQLTPFEWIDVIAAVDGVITMYFHGLCFSLITGTPFFAVEKRASNNESSKLFGLLDQLGIEGKYVLGTENAINSLDFRSFMSSAQKGERDDNRKYIAAARNEFAKFVKIIRNDI